MAKIKLPWVPPVHLLVGNIREDNGDAVMICSMSPGGAVCIRFHAYITPTGELAVSVSEETP